MRQSGGILPKRDISRMPVVREDLSACIWSDGGRVMGRIPNGRREPGVDAAYIYDWPSAPGDGLSSPRKARRNGISPTPPGRSDIENPASVADDAHGPLAAIRPVFSRSVVLQGARMAGL